MALEGLGRGRVDAAHGQNPRALKFQAERRFKGGRKDVHDPSPDGHIPWIEDPADSLIAEPHQLRQESL
ncbi:MAG TPA: hypothetical protein DCP69_10980 [Candidatus Omnitrophica bacterium]|nr:hypothetical protein [Candidatus Omnitrophota bacterium]